MENATQERANFLSLPAELRNRIYSYTFRCDLSTLWNPDQRFWYRGHECSCTGLALLRVCRQIRADTIPIFYGNHTMRFDAYNRAFLEDWLNITVPEAITRIRRIELFGYMQGIKGWTSTTTVDLRGREAAVECFVECKKRESNVDEVKEILTCNVKSIVQDLERDELGRVVFSRELLGEVFDILFFDQES
jgi:hypothetical protein